MRTTDGVSKARLIQTIGVLTRLEKVLVAVEEDLAQLDSRSYGWCDEDFGELTLKIDSARDAADRIKVALTKARDFVAEGFCQLIAETHSGKFKCPALKATFSGSVKYYPSAPSQIREPEKFEELVSWLKLNGYGNRIEVGLNGRYVIDGLGEVVEGLAMDGRPFPPHVECHMVPAVKITRHKSAALG